MSLVSNVVMKIRLGELGTIRFSGGRKQSLSIRQVIRFVSANFQESEAISSKASVSPDFAEHTIVSRIELWTPSPATELSACTNVPPDFLRGSNARFIRIRYGEHFPVGDTEFCITQREIEHFPSSYNPDRVVAIDGSLAIAGMVCCWLVSGFSTWQRYSMVDFIYVDSVCVKSADHQIVPARNLVYYFRRLVKYFPPAPKAFLV